MSSLLLEAGYAFLAEAGLNLTAVFSWDMLPDTVKRPLQEAGLDHHSHLLLTAHGGKQLWRQVQKIGMEPVDPIDRYSLHITEQFLAEYLDNPAYDMLYPGTHLFFPLQPLGELAGWGQSSPLGQGIHPDYGLWYAFRTAVAFTADIPVRIQPQRPHPCDGCADKPCISICPPKAVQTDQFKVMACAHYRSGHASSCSYRCLAREACPIAPEHHYTPEQIQYHYRQSLITIKQYLAEM